MGLINRGIGVSIHYAVPVPLMSYYAKKYGYETGDFPNAERYANQSISLPVHPKISKGDIKYICESLMELIGEN